MTWGRQQTHCAGSEFHWSLVDICRRNQWTCPPCRSRWSHMFLCCGKGLGGRGLWRRRRRREENVLSNSFSDYIDVMWVSSVCVWAEGTCLETHTTMCYVYYIQILRHCCCCSVAPVISVSSVSTINRPHPEEEQVHYLTSEGAWCKNDNCALYHCTLDHLYRAQWVSRWNIRDIWDTPL